MGKFKRIKTKCLSVITALVILLMPLTLPVNAVTTASEAVSADETAVTYSTVPTVHVLTHTFGGLSVLLEYNGHFGLIDSGEDKDHPGQNDTKYWHDGIVTDNEEGAEDYSIPYFKDLGVTKDNFDFFIGTHPHSDHIGAADEIIREFRPKKVYLQEYSDSYVTGELWDNRYVYDRTIAAARATGAELIQDLTAQENHEFYLGPHGDTTMKIEIKNYGDDYKYQPTDDANDFSLGVLVKANGKSMFISGDINNFGGDEDRLATELKTELGADGVDALVLGHHGVYGSNSYNYVTTLNPELMIIPGSFSNVSEKGILYDKGLLETLWYMGTKENPSQLFATDWLKEKYPETEEVNKSLNVYLNSTGVTTNVPSGFEYFAETELSDGIWTGINYVDGLPYYDETKNFRNEDGIEYDGTSYKNGYYMTGKWVGSSYDPNDANIYKFESNKDNSCVTGWHMIYGKWYYFNSEGKLVTGWNEIDGNKYYLDILLGGAIRTGLFTDTDGKQYYFALDGKMMTGWVTIGNDRYYFYEDETVEHKKGEMAKSTLVGTNQYVNSSGVYEEASWQVDGTVKVGGTQLQKGWLIWHDGYYYIDPTTHTYVTGWQTVDNITYYFKDSHSSTSGFEGGQMVTGPCNIDGKLYYFSTGTESRPLPDASDENSRFGIGAKITQNGGDPWILTKDGKWYYIDITDDHSLVTGWKTVTGSEKVTNYYYFDPTTGEMQTGLTKVGDYYYYLRRKGDGGSEGSCIVDSGVFTACDGKSYYIRNGSGDIDTDVEVWYEPGDNYKYYVQSDHSLAKGATKIGDDIYYFVNDGEEEMLGQPVGSMLTGWYPLLPDDVEDENLKYNKTRYYYFDTDGKMVKGLKEIGGKIYYFDESDDVYASGVMYNIGWKKVGDDWYYFSVNGEALTGLQRAKNGDGNYGLYYFDADGKMVTDKTKLPDYLSQCIINNGGALSNGNLANENDITDNSVHDIRFKLFDYDESINFKDNTVLKNNNSRKDVTSSDVKTVKEYFGDSANQRSVAEYFSFSGSKPYKATYTDLSRTLDAGGFDKNHATVERKLTGNYPVLDINRNAIGEPKIENPPTLSPEDRDIGYLFGETTDSAVTAYAPTNTILKKDGNHYTYDSKNNAVDYDSINNKFCVRNYAERGDETATYNASNNNNYGDFLPFNYTNGQVVGQLADVYEYNIAKSDMDYWFGMRMDFDFYQTPDGKIVDDNGNDKGNMIFNFSGDDDVWVFIDDVLVLDLGGTHGVVSGSINFADGTVEQYINWLNENGKETGEKSYPTTIKKCFEAADNAVPNGGWSDKNSNIFADNTKHTLSFFYLERGSGSSNCMIDFNLYIPPADALAVEKNVYNNLNKTENLNNEDESTYQFKIERTSGNTDKTDEFICVDNFDNVKDVDSDGKFTLKAGEKVWFTNLGTDNTYKVTELTDSFTKSTDVIVNDTKNSNQKSGTITASVNTEESIVFNNYVDVLKVNLKYYGRETVNGKPADIKKVPTTYTKSYIGQDYLKYVNSTEENIQKDPIGAMILDTSVTFDYATEQQDTKYRNVLDGYEMWISQAQAKAGIASFDNLHSKIDDVTYNKYTATPYHTNWYGYTQQMGDDGKWYWTDGENGAAKTEVADGQHEKWVTYYSYANGSKTEVEENSGEVTEVTVWLFNQPKQYTVEAYEANNFNNLTPVDGKYVASGGNPKTIQAYYNQRLGLEIDENAEYSKATDHLKGYGINSYVGEKLETAYSVKDSSGNTYKFAYWAFDENGKNIASTDILYNYRIVTNTTLYAVYTSDGKVNEGKPGLTVSENERDIFFNSSGTSITRLNTEMNPYNCQNKDSNIKNVAIVYVIDQDGSLVTNYTDDMRSAIKENLSIISSNSALTADSNGSFTITLNEDGHKVNYFAFVVDGFNANTAGDISLTNKNRIEFGSDFQTKALYGDGDKILPKRMYAFAAMYYNGSYTDNSGQTKSLNEWIVSDNFIDYDFTTTSATAE